MSVPEAARERAEADLAGHARDFDPRRLRVIAYRMLANLGLVGDLCRGGKQSRDMTARVNDRLTVRPARPDELEEVGRLTVQAYLADGLVDPAGPYVAQLADASRRASDAELLVAVDPEGMVVGTITVCPPGSPLGEVSRPGELEFRMLAVAPGARCRGVGEALVRTVLARARKTGAHRVVLCSTQEMHPAHRLYARLGFIRMPERDWNPLPGFRLLAFGATTERSGPQ